MEQLANFPAVTTLNMPGDLNSSATTLTLTSIAAPFPASFPFRILIDDELMKVTATPGANQWTVTRGDGGTTATSHLNAAGVQAVLSKESLDSLVSVQQAGSEVSNRRILNFLNATVTDHSGSGSADITLSPTLTGVSSAIPAAASGNANQLYLPTDGPILQRSNGSVWSPYGPVFPLTTPPLVASWSWVNQGSATAVDSAAGLYMQCDLVNSDNWRMLVKTVPTAPYTITAAFTGIMCGNKDSRISLIARDSGTGKFVAWGINYDSFNNEFKVALTTFNSATSGNANVFFQRLMTVFPILFLRMTDDNTNRIYYISIDGVNWIQVYSESRTTWMTANQVGWGLNPGGSSGFPVAATLLSWSG
jgi:hypothetical protein